MVSSEVAPLAKTGGLADVVAALPEQLIRNGHHCSVFLPAFRQVFEAAGEVTDLHLGFPVPLGDRHVTARILKTTIADGLVTCYLVDQPQFFDRNRLYGEIWGDYQDNCARFVFFNRAVLEAINRLRLPIDIIHCHDWQAGLIPAYLKSGVMALHNSPNLGIVTTIHNLAYQGRYWAADYRMTGLPWDLFNDGGLEFYGDLCFLKSAIVYADQITTVSNQYAKEIQTPQFGCALEGVLATRADRISGIVNGVDYNVWNPQTDSHIAKNYDVNNWREGKAACKTALQNELGLPVDANRPMIGVVGRMASQKGWDILIPVIERWLSHTEIQWAVLGNGESRFEEWLGYLHSKFPDRLALRTTFSEPLAHRIESAVDIFAMPSQYEPCGLNQLYSLRYGTVPLVHAVGGLVDTVRPFSQDSSQNGATGFAFNDYNPDALDECLQTAIAVFYEQPDRWAEIVEAAMRENWSWSESAAQYEDVYRKAGGRS